MRAITFLLLLFALPAWADTGTENLFVRPFAECSAFNGNGTAFACATSNGGVGAWRGFPSVNGSATPGTDTIGAIDGGDVLYVCGSFGPADRDFGALGAVSSAMLDPGVVIAGVVGKRVTITGDCSSFGGPSRATVTGGGTAGVDYGFRLTGAYVSVTRIDFQNFWASSNPALGLGTFTSEPADLFVFDVTMTDVGLGNCVNCNGIEINSNGGSLSNISMTNIGNDGIYVGNGATGATPTTISNVSLLNVSATIAQGDGVQQEPGAGAITLSNVTIRLNPRSIKACAIVGNATNRIVVDDVRCDSGGANAGGVVIDGSGPGSSVTRVFAINGQGAGLFIRDDAAQVTSPLTVSGNIFANYQYGLLLDGAHSSFPNIDANVFTGTVYGVWALSSWNPAAGSTLRDNVISSPGSMVFVDAAVAAADWESNFNSFSGGGNFNYRGATYNTFAAYQAGATQDANSVSADPLFIGGSSPTTPEGFRPGPGSPLCGVGTLISRGMNDFIGINFASIPAIGAIECGVPKVQMTDQNRLRLQ